VFGKQIIYLLQRKQIGESIRDLGLEGQMQKKGTPTMGGIIILGSILIPVLLFGDLLNVYIQLMLITTAWLGFVGFLDDYIKVFKKNKEGLRGKFKIAGQVILGIVVGFTMYFSSDIVIRERVKQDTVANADRIVIESDDVRPSVSVFTHDLKSTKVNVPFFKNNEFDYFELSRFLVKKPTFTIVFVIAVF
jgi:phospho-N-acetylmuramoyl-pentapeptide-transferase